MHRCSIFSLFVILSVALLSNGNVDEISGAWIKEKLNIILASGFAGKELEVSEGYKNYVQRQHEWREEISSFPIMTVVRCNI